MSPLSNAERQRRWREKIKDRAAVLDRKPKKIAEALLNGLGRAKAERVLRALVEIVPMTVYPDEDEDVPDQTGQLPPQMRRRGFIHRAKEAAQFARDDDLNGMTFDEEMRRAAEDAAEAWRTISDKITK